jgi:23S rRNA (cytidine2498-2'-O)-methyltransferase
VTFKCSRPEGLPSGFKLRSVFARCWGFSVGPQKSLTQAALAIQDLYAKLPLQQTPATVGLDVWERDLFTVGEEPKNFVTGKRALEWRTTLISIIQAHGLAEPSPDSEWIVDFCGIDAENPEFWLGYHLRKSRPQALGPGGTIEVAMPADSPSRAFIKLEQALAHSGAQPLAGQCALEIGSAPGGASYALLLRGLEVIGVDPAEMSPMILERPGFTHVQKTVTLIQANDLHRPVEWLVLDINAKPKITLGLIEQLLARAPSRFVALKGMILTLKMNDWKLARFVPEWLDKVKTLATPFGLAQISAQQLAANRQEICVVARKRIA